MAPRTCGSALTEEPASGASFSRGGTWCLWRIDDHDNRFLVARYADRAEAEAAAAAFASHGHKQVYFVEAASEAPRDQSPDALPGP